jgi:hypothetical protein
MQSEKIDLLVKALVKVQGALTPALKNRTNPHFKSQYADLESDWAACRKLLTENDLAIIQTSGLLEGGACLRTVLCHASGQWIDGEYPLNPQQATPQSLGTAVKYARRYALEAMIGLVTSDDPEDDDGNLSSTQHNAPPRAQALSQPRPVSQPSNSGIYTVDFGKKHFGKTLAEMGTDEVISYANWIRNSDKDGKGIGKQAQRFLDEVSLFLNPPGMNEDDIPF